MGGDALSGLQGGLGRAVGILGALTSVKQGGLANYLMSRQRMLADPAFRATLVNSPFSAGVFGVGGGAAPAGALPGSEFANVPAGAWLPHLAPLGPEQFLKTQQLQTVQAGLTSADPVVRAQAKQAAGIPLTQEELPQAVAGAGELLKNAPPGSQVTLDIPGGRVSVGSPYASYTSGIYPTYGDAAAAGAGTGRTPVPTPGGGYSLSPQPSVGEYPDPDSAARSRQPGEVTVPTGRGTFQNVTPPKVDQRPETLPPLGAPQPLAPGAPPAPPAVVAPPPPPAPGHVNLSAPFFRQLEAERNLPVGVLSGLAEQESGGNPNAANPASSARGLYQITKDTARAWGVSADDRYDPVRSAVATANTLAERAQQHGIVRAVGMHYGGPAAPFAEKVGPSGLSPAQFAASVFSKAQKYATPVAGALFSPSKVYAAEAPPDVVAAAPPQPIAPPAPAPAVVAAPPPPPPVVVAPAPAPPPPAPVFVGPPAPPAPVPVMVAAAEPPPDNRVGYPPPAPTAPATSATTVVLPPSAGVQLAPPGGLAPIPGPGGLPIETLSQTSQAGETRTFKAPEDLAAKQRELTVQADVQRLRSGGTAEDDKVLNSLYNYRTKLAELKAEFPTAAARAPYAGHPYKAGMAHLAERFVEPDPKRVAFEGAVAPFSLKAFETSGASMSEHEEALILPNLPTGNEPSQARFENKLGKFEDGLEAAIAFRTTIARLPVEQRTPEVLGDVQRQIMEQQQARKAARDEAAQGAATAPPAAPPPAAAAPPTAPPTMVVPAPSAAPTATGEPSAAPSGGAQVRQVLLPERSFWSQAPGIGGAITGGMAGAAIGAPFLPPVGPIVGGLIGAGLGGMAGEGVQVGAERLGMVPTAETGTAAERAARAGTRGMVGEVLGAPLRVGSWMLASQVGPVAKAAEELAPVLARDLPASTKAVEAASGGFRNIGRLLKNPAELAAAELTPEGQQTLLRAWWGNMATKKPDKIIAAWDAMEPEAQAALAGAQHGAMETVIDTLRTGASPIGWVKLLTGTSSGAATAALGHPGVGATVAALPAVHEVATKAVPMIAAPMLQSATGAAMLGALPRVAEVAGPMVSIPYRAATQVGTTMLWPQPAP